MTIQMSMCLLYVYESTNCSLKWLNGVIVFVWVCYNTRYARFTRCMTFMCTRTVLYIFNTLHEILAPMHTTYVLCTIYVAILTRHGTPIDRCNVNINMGGGRT